MNEIKENSYGKYIICDQKIDWSNPYFYNYEGIPDEDLPKEVRKIKESDFLRKFDLYNKNFDER